MYSNRSFTVPVLPTCRESVPQVTCGAKLLSPALGAPTAQRRQPTLRFEGRLGLSGLPPPEFGSPTGGLSPCHGSQAICLPAGAQAAQASSNWSLGKRESVPLAPGTDPALHPDLLLFTSS